MDPIWRVIEQNLRVFRHWTQNEKRTKQTLDWLGCALREWFIDQALSTEDAEALAEETIYQICLKFQDEDSDRSQHWSDGGFQSWCLGLAAKQCLVVTTRTVAPPKSVCRALRIAIDLLATGERWLMSWHLGQTDDATAAVAVGVSVADLTGAWGREALEIAIVHFRDLYEGNFDLVDWLEPPEGDSPSNDRPYDKPPMDSLFVSAQLRKENLHDE
jgi:hypothetical protein